MWVSVLSAGVGIGFFGVTSLVLAWFGGDDPAIPVTEVGYGALLGIIITTGVLVQVRAPERKIAGVQQALLGIVALLFSAPLASDPQNLAPGLALLAAMAVLIGLHPGRRELVRPGSGFSVPLASIAGLGAIPLVGYALTMAAQARELVGPPASRPAAVVDGGLGDRHLPGRPSRGDPATRLVDPRTERRSGSRRLRPRFNCLPD
jgi:hypothetical protein